MPHINGKSNEISSCRGSGLSLSVLGIVNELIIVFYNFAVCLIHSVLDYKWEMDSRRWENNYEIYVYTCDVRA
jgi:hypothetical protein